MENGNNERGGNEMLSSNPFGSLACQYLSVKFKEQVSYIPERMHLAYYFQDSDKLMDK